MLCSILLQNAITYSLISTVRHFKKTKLIAYASTLTIYRLITALEKVSINNVAIYQSSCTHVHHIYIQTCVHTYV
jgi:hypothetical protein